SLVRSKQFCIHHFVFFKCQQIPAFPFIYIDDTGPCTDLSCAYRKTTKCIHKKDHSIWTGTYVLLPASYSSDTPVCINCRSYQRVQVVRHGINDHDKSFTGTERIWLQFTNRLPRLGSTHFHFVSIL